MTTKSVSSSVIDLPYWESGKRRIRYLYLVGEKSFQVTKPRTNEVNKYYYLFILFFIHITHTTL